MPYCAYDFTAQNLEKYAKHFYSSNIYGFGSITTSLFVVIQQESYKKNEFYYKSMNVMKLTFVGIFFVSQMDWIKDSCDDMTMYSVSQTDEWTCWLRNRLRIEIPTNVNGPEKISEIVILMPLISLLK